MVKIGGYTSYPGRMWKTCPFSTTYYNKYYAHGWAGNTTNPDITQDNFSSVVTASHPDTEGTMNMWNHGGTPGWICWDDACPYYIDNGVRYFEY